MQRVLLSLALAGVLVTPVALATDGPDLTLYRSNDNSLFQSGAQSIDSGYAVIREQRNLGYAKGAQDLTIGNLPSYLEPEAVTLSFGSDHVKVLSQRLLLSQGHNGALIGQIGKQVSVIGDNGQTLVQGQLESVGHDGSLVIGGDVFGPTVVQQYSAVKLLNGEIGGGSRLIVHVQADNDGHSNAVLTYPTHGLGWRAAYTATLQPGNSCRMRLRAQASIANRSGRDWNDADIKLVAGQPNIGGNNGGPRPAMMSFRAKSEAAPMPQQGTLDAYRTFALPGSVDLPDNSVTLTPLYAPRMLDCQRTWTFENGNAWTPSRPMTNASMDANATQGAIASVLQFQAPDTLPEGHMRVLTADKDGALEFIGEGSVADTPEHAQVRLTLGSAFDLRAQRERTSFNYDKAERRIDEGFRITLTNTGDNARTVSVIEHPTRWTQWTLTSSSEQPARQTPDTLEFHVDVPAHGTATLDYAVRYQWTSAED
ncbi:DUF4139 domain-containing protein [Oleiagrimonas soli]|uniref:DUF4139 domain-containing protein n=1 Tax=Oleiagrimonas soli TaxID=1543381 RepID=A0A099CW86_9GAMM|nr:DUF4139 domain-containing protein [Oleiagrimonas soli]KGI77921.1 hypothetical protein LF63_0105855 [Oleiagrimonas soli]MBB6183712.1 hypothetical protein [Oleiagrimonas soli]